MSDFLAEWGGVCPVYMQVGFYPTPEFGPEEREKAGRLCEELCRNLERRGLHPKRWEFRGNDRYHSAFVYLTDDQPDWERVEEIIRTADEEIEAVFGERTPLRFRHRFWTY